MDIIKTVQGTMNIQGQGNFLAPKYGVASASPIMINPNSPLHRSIAEDANRIWRDGWAGRKISFFKTQIEISAMDEGWENAPRVYGVIAVDGVLAKEIWEKVDKKGLLPAYGSDSHFLALDL